VQDGVKAMENPEDDLKDIEEFLIPGSYEPTVAEMKEVEDEDAVVFKDKETAIFNTGISGQIKEKTFVEGRATVGKKKTKKLRLVENKSEKGGEAKRNKKVGKKKLKSDEKEDKKLAKMLGEILEE